MSDSRNVLKDEDVTEHQDDASGVTYTSKLGKNGMFHSVQANNKGTKQTTNINIKIENPKDDCCGSCLDALKTCFKKGN